MDKFYHHSFISSSFKCILVLVLLMLYIYVYAIGGIIFFADADPWNFGNIETTMLTMFRVVTLDVSITHCLLFVRIITISIFITFLPLDMVR